MRIYMQTPALDARAPRYYQLLLQPDMLGGWSLVREWGAQGEAGRVKREHFDSFEEAEAVLERARDEQVRRGYRIVFTQGQQPV